MEISCAKLKEFNIDENSDRMFNFDDILYLHQKQYQFNNDLAKPIYIGFKSIDTFLENLNNYSFDVESKIIVTKDGYVFCPLKAGSINEKSVTDVSTTDTEKNIAE